MKRALVVDDNKLFSDSLELMLEDLGYDVTVKSNPDHVNSVDGAFDLILCDMMMPTELSDTDGLDEEFGEDGQSVMVGVHALHRFSKEFPGASLIAMSGLIEGSMLKALSSFGAKVSLKKPFSMEELEGAIARAAGSQAGASA